MKNLVLRDTVLEAITAKKFHLYSIKTIEDGIKVLTGVPAGEKQADGSYPEGSVFGKVQKKLARYHRLSGRPSR